MFVYFIQALTGGPVKIGRSAKVEQRLRAVQRYNPETLTIKALARGWGGAERRVHRLFDLDRLRDDWFHPSPELLAFMDRLPGYEQYKCGDYIPLISAKTDTYQVLAKHGFTLQQIGDHFGITKQAVWLHTGSTSQNHRPAPGTPRPEISIEQFIEENSSLFVDDIELK